MMVIGNNKCAYGMVTRQMVTDIKEDIGSIKKGLESIKNENKVMFNHLSTRLPWWATIMITGLVSLCVGLIVRGIYL